MENKLGVIWVRVSSEQQTLGYSQENQLEVLQAACREKGIKVIKIFNVAESAKTSEKRKLFREMLKFIQEENIVYLVAKNIKRLQRNYEDLFRIDDMIEKNGLHVFIFDENKIVSKNSPPADRFMFRILGALAQMDNEERAGLARENMLAKARGGGLPNKAPFGYRNIPDPTDQTGKKRTIAKVQEEAALVPQAFELYDSGNYSLETLKDELIRRGFSFSQRGVQELLKRSAYYGWFSFAGQLYKWDQEALISKDLFDRVQVRMAQACTSPHKDARKWFAFKKFLRCGYCQSSITAEIQSGLTYYRCTFGKPYQNGRCPQKYFREEEIDKVISSEMASLNINGSWIDKLKEQLKADHQAEDKHVQNEKKRLEIELAKYQNRSAKLIDAWADGLISKDEYKAKKIEYSEKICQAESDLKGLDKVNLEYKEQGAEILDLLRNFPNYYRSADQKGKQALLNVCLDRLILRGSQYQVNWKPPFDMLFPLALIKSSGRGE
jgi:DNA invertase Pin-like site-specific DNA recombinase